jgi:hypothetical protein
VKKLFKIMFVLLLGAAAVGGYMAWRSGCCRDWGSQGSWSQWSSCDDDQGAETTT